MAHDVTVLISLVYFGKAELSESFALAGLDRGLAPAPAVCIDAKSDILLRKCVAYHLDLLLQMDVGDGCSSQSFKPRNCGELVLVPGTCVRISC